MCSLKLASAVLPTHVKGSAARRVDKVLELTVLSLVQAKRIVAPLLKPGGHQVPGGRKSTKSTSGVWPPRTTPKRAANTMMPARAPQGGTGKEGL